MRWRSGREGATDAMSEHAFPTTPLVLAALLPPGGAHT